MKRMTNREKQSAEDILCGKAPGIVTALIMMATLMLITFLFVVFLAIGGKLGLQDSVGVMVAELFVFGFFIIMFVIIIDMIVGYFVHCNILKEQFENLPEWKKEKLLFLAHNYGNRKQIYVEDNYIYGVMSEQRHGRKIGVYTLTFRYIDFSEVVWAYKIERQIVMGGMNSAMVPTSNAVVHDKKLRLYTRDGRYFQGTCSESENEKIFKMLKEKNPSCKLGYKEEWKTCL